MVQQEIQYNSKLVYLFICCGASIVFSGCPCVRLSVCRVFGDRSIPGDAIDVEFYSFINLFLEKKNFNLQCFITMTHTVSSMSFSQITHLSSSGVLQRFFG